jgi:hypothetical protein
MKTIMAVVFISVALKAYSQEKVHLTSDTTKNKYAILRMNWNSKEFYIKFEDGTRDYKSSFGNLFTTLSYDDESTILMDIFTRLKKEGYILIDSFDRNTLNFFLFIKR